MSTGNFKNAVNIVIEHEGGFVDDPDDHGGATNFGITQRTLDEYRKVHLGFPAHVVDLKPDDARAIYQDIFWPPFAEIVSPELATVLFDQAVLRGPEKVVALLQELIGVKVDGVMGPNTIGGANRLAGDELAFRFVRASHHRYTDIVRRDPSQIKFLDGWEDRLFSLIDHLFFGSV